MNSYNFAKPNQVALDMQNLYQSIYEGKKVDQDQDGDNDGADVMIARMIASGMSREEAIRRTRKKSYNKENYELDQLAILYLVQEGYAEDLRAAQAIYENASSEFKQNLQEVAPAIVAGAARLAPLAARLGPKAGAILKSGKMKGVAKLGAKAGLNALSNMSSSNQEQEQPTSGEKNKENKGIEFARGVFSAGR
jgi:hypothetical protein